MISKFFMFLKAFIFFLIFWSSITFHISNAEAACDDGIVSSPVTSSDLYTAACTTSLTTFTVTSSGSILGGYPDVGTAVVAFDIFSTSGTISNYGTIGGTNGTINILASGTLNFINKSTGVIYGNYPVSIMNNIRSFTNEGQIYVDGQNAYGALIVVAGNISNGILNTGALTVDATSSNNPTNTNETAPKIIGDMQTIYIDTGKSINEGITNTGTIINVNPGRNSYGIENAGSVDFITNTGSITAGNYGIKNSGTITRLNNRQGASSSALTYHGILPTYYNIVINSTSDFGKIIFTLPSGSTTFGIYTGSTVAAGTYQDVLTGVTGSHLSSLSGTYGSYSWTLASDTTNYDLTITGSSPSRSAYNEIVTSPKLANTATQLEAIRTKGTKTTLINALDALSSTQLESALKKIQGTTTVKAAAQSVQAQSSFKTALSTVTSPGSSSSMTNVTKTNQGNLTFADLQKNNLYAKIQPANYSDDSAFFDYKNNQVPVNALEFFKSNRNVNLVEKDDFKESGIFLRTFGSITNYAAINSDDNSYGSDSYGLLGGFQHKIDENLYQGYSLGFSKSKLTLDAGEGNTKTNTIHANVYRKMDEKEYGVTASLGGYVSFIDNVRNISETSEILKSSPTNGGLDFSVQYVKKMELLGLNFYPSASFTTTYGIVKNYKETGGSGSALEIKSHNVLAIKPEIGFTLENNFIQTDKITEGANFSLFANRQQYLDGHTNTSSMIGENSWSASTLPKTKDDFLTAGIGYVAKNIDEKSDLNFNFFYTQSTNNSLNSSLFSISYNKTF